MPVVYSNTADGTCVRFTFGGVWSSCRGGVASSFTPNTTNTSGTMTDVLFSQFGATPFFVVGRSFYWFDTSGITGTVDSVDFELYGATPGLLTNGGDFIAVKSNAFGGDGGSALANGDFDAMPGWNGSADATGNVTDYTAAYSISSGWSTTGYNSIAGTSSLKADMENNDIVIICVLNYTYDYKNTTASPILRVSNGAAFANYTGTTRDPRLNYTLGTGSSGYANTFKGVAAGNIGKINGVATASISKVNGI